MGAHPVEHVNAVRVIIARHELRAPAVAHIGQRLFEQQIHGPARSIEKYIVSAVLISPPGIVEMGKIKLVDPFHLHEVEQLRQFRRIILRHGETQTHLDAPVAAQAKAAHGSLEGPFLTAESVMGISDAVDADCQALIKSGTESSGCYMGCMVVNHAAVVVIKAECFEFFGQEFSA